MPGFAREGAQDDVMDHKKLSQEDFDAIVTGELTHYAAWLEDELIDIISDYFQQLDRRADFQRLLLRRDGLTFQDKIEIVRALLPLFANRLAAERLKVALPEIETFKATRNAFAHGRDVTPPDSKSLTLHVEVVSRAGKEKVIVVTPESHEAFLTAAERLLKEVQDVRGKLFLPGA
jgi:hypothetical protein